MSGCVAAILLAAGKSSRMGRCKQLLPIGENTVIGRSLDTLVTAGITQIIVVVSPEGHDVCEAVGKYPVKVVVNDHVAGDMASSVLTGRDALSAEISGVVVALCDYPLVRPGTVSRLVAEHEQFNGYIIIPCNEGKRGHPLLIPRRLLDVLLDGMTLRDLVWRDMDQVRCVEVNDRGILLDMDMPEDYQRICELI